jgi:primosomal protein N'
MSDTKESKDIFSVCTKNVEKFFSEIEKTTPKYQESAAELQKNYITAWKNVINSAIALEQEYATKAGLRVDVPDAALDAVRTITRQASDALESQNKAVANSAEATRQAFNAFNENTKSFASLNRNIMGFMMSVLEKRPNS